MHVKNPSCETSLDRKASQSKSVNFTIGRYDNSLPLTRIAGELLNVKWLIQLLSCDTHQFRRSQYAWLPITCAKFNGSHLAEVQLHDPTRPAL